ncbi:MAG: MATE family efflux transporter [Chloroflexota bacterium]
MKRTALERDWTKGSIVGSLLSLSWPMIVTRTIMAVRPTIDMIVVGRLGAASVAGVGIGTIATQMAEALKQGLTIGVRALIARLIGAEDKQGAIHAAQQGYVISAIFAIFLAAVGVFLTEPILLLLGVETDVAAQCAPYMRITFVGGVFMVFRMMNDAIMEASGDSITPMKITIVYTIFHAVLCPFLVFGWWFFPRLETSGAAWAGIASQCLGASIGLWVLLTGRSRLRLTFRNFRLDPKVIWRIVKIGLPGSITGMERGFAQFMVLWFLVPFGTLAVAAHSLSLRVDQFIHMPVAAWGIGAGVLGGQNLGARQPERAQRTAWLGVGLSTILMFIISIVIWFWAEGLALIFTPESDLIELTAIFFRIEIATYLVFGIVMILQQFLLGVGDTLPVMLITLVTMWGIQMPLAYFLPRVGNLGVYGVRWALVAGVVTRAIAYLPYFTLGTWKQKKV